MVLPSTDPVAELSGLNRVAGKALSLSRESHATAIIFAAASRPVLQNRDVGNSYVRIVANADEQPPQQTFMARIESQASTA